MFGRLIGPGVACALQLLEQLVQWQNCTEFWVFPVSDRPDGENSWKRALADGRLIDATALAITRDPKIETTASPGELVVNPAASIFRPVFHRMGFHGHVEIFDGNAYLVGEYRISDGWIAFYTALNAVVLIVAWFVPLPLIMRAVTEQGAAYSDLFTRPGEFVAVALFVILVLFILSVISGALILCLRCIGYINRLLNLPDRRKLTGFLAQIRI
ncbi:MAG: hypothetical protein WD767_02005 [Alphaproteobacteria bacterium]